MKILFFLIFFSFAFCLFQNEEIIFKIGDYQLEVIRINGKTKGKTLLIFGGIHGDEPGGHFSSEMLRNIHLEKGQLIVVPRINFPSIMLNRRELHGDMNRKFTDGQDPKDPEQPIIQKLKGLMSEADIFVNQHDASGFHRDTHISTLYNPEKYGQSLIVDTAFLSSPRHKRTINLEELGRQIIQNVNQKIPNTGHHFCFWNHNSITPDTMFSEMRKSATHFATTRYNIPAFGLETSKDLPALEDKIRYQLLVIQEIMLAFDFKFHFEKFEMVHPKLFWVELKNNKNEFLHTDSNTIIRLNPKEKITISSIHANYPSGLSADILEWGSLNDMQKEFSFDKPRTVFIKKNHLIIGRLFFQTPKKNSVLRLNYILKGEKRSIPNWGVISAATDDIIQVSNDQPQMLGWQLKLTSNEDASTSLLLQEKPGLININKLNPSHSFLGEGKTYHVRLYHQNALYGGFQINLLPKESTNKDQQVSSKN